MCMCVCVLVDAVWCDMRMMECDVQPALAVGDLQEVAFLVLRSALRPFANGATLEEEQERDGCNTAADEGEEKDSVLELEVVEELRESAKAFTGCFERSIRTCIIHSGTEAPTQERIKVLAATADAAKLEYESTMYELAEM